MGKFLKYFGPLFMEKKNGSTSLSFSVGRVSWWIVFVPAVYIWVSTLGEQDISDHHAAMLLILAGYNLGKHGLETLKSKISNQPADGAG